MLITNPSTGEKIYYANSLPESQQTSNNGKTQEAQRRYEEEQRQAMIYEQEVKTNIYDKENALRRNRKVPSGR